MKKLATFFAACVVCTALSAQTLNIVSGNVTYSVPAVQAGEMVYADGQTITVLGKTLNMSEITRMYIDDSAVTDNTVNVTYSGSEAYVVIAGNIMQYVTPSVSGAYVSLTQEATVGDTTCGEISYSLSGESADGQFTLTGSYKATVNLYGLSLTCATGAPLNIQNSKRIELSVKSGTENTLKDCAGGTQKGCLVCTGHLELKGNGILNVTGLTGHAIYAKEYVTMKNCTINVLGSVKDGLNCNQYFTMTSGTLNISGIGDDALQVSFKDDVNREAEDTGTITVNGGSITAEVTATAAKGLKADGNAIFTNGDIKITTSGGGKWDTTDLKTKASTCISADGYIQVDGGTFDLTSTGSGGKGFSCDGEFIYNGGNTTISTSGGIFAYVNGTTYDNYTGNTDNLDSDYKSSAKGIKADGNVTISGGNINVTTTGNGAEGIESKAILTINDGTIVANTRDDAINSSSHMYIKGGNITVVATNNDGLDANGNLYIEGGVVRAFGAGSPECGLDANEEQNYHVYFTGGMVLAVGGGNSVPNSSASTQPYVSGSASLTAGSTVTLSSNGTTLATFTVPSNYTSSGGSTGGGGRPGRPGSSSGGSSVLVSCPGLTAGSSYTLACGSSSSTVTAQQYGSGGMRP